MSTTDFTQFTKADLVKLLEGKHGIKVENIAKVTKNYLIERINDLEGNTMPQALGEQAVNELAPRDGQRLKHVVINIHIGHDSMGQSDVKVGYNGNRFVIKRGVNVTIPVGVYQVLNNAVEDTFVPQIDPSTKKPFFKKVAALRHPFSVIEKVYG